MKAVNHIVKWAFFLSGTSRCSKWSWSWTITFACSICTPCCTK